MPVIFICYIKWSSSTDSSLFSNNLIGSAYRYLFMNMLADW